MKKMLDDKKLNCGFTLIELLVVISVVGILSAFLIRVINIERHRNEAEDAVKVASVAKLSEGIDAYVGVEEEIPVNYSDASDYMTWITGYQYVTVQPALIITAYRIYIESSLNPGDYITYFSESGNILLCPDVPTDTTDPATCISVY